MRILGKRCYSFTTSTECTCEIVRDIEEKLVYVAKHFAAGFEMVKAEMYDIKKNHESPHGQEITILAMKDFDVMCY